MDHVLTLIAPPGGLSTAALHSARDALAGIGATTGTPAWLARYRPSMMASSTIELTLMRMPLGRPASALSASASICLSRLRRR